jgi:cytochrome c-type biogenesis protein
MTLFIISFVAGVLTVLAPCILPLLPVVIGSSVGARSKATPYIVIGSLAFSILIFTYILKVSTAFISIPPFVWSYISGGILFGFGLILVFPKIWESLPFVNKASTDANILMGAGHQKKSIWGDVMVGAALGPVFSSCSPTYFVILATVLPASFFLGSLYLLAYLAGLVMILVFIALL